MRISSSTLAVIAPVVFGCASFAHAGTDPIAPADYATMIGQGFASDWFKGSLGVDYTDASLTRTMTDLKAEGFTSLRLRSKADVYGAADTGALGQTAASTLDSASMGAYLNEMETVVNRAVANGVTPVISWIHDAAEARANAQDGNNFVAWWTAVATRFRDADSRLSFNLMTEIGQQSMTLDGVTYNYNLYTSVTTWRDWTTRAISAIRATGGANATRNIIVTAPQNGKASSLDTMDPTGALWANDDHLLFELHDYAAGPKSSGARAWTGTGTADQRKAVTDMMDAMVAFSGATGADGYYGAWMPMDNKTGTLSQSEIESFAAFFAEEAAKRGLPTGLNKLDNYYDAKTNTWLTSVNIGGRSVDVASVLNSIQSGRAAGLAAVPEPSAWGLLGGFAGGALALRRLRRRVV